MFAYSRLKCLASAILVTAANVSGFAQDSSKFVWAKVISQSGFSHPHFVGTANDLAWIDSRGFSIVDPKTGVVKWSFPVRGASGEVWLSKDKARVRYGSSQGLATVDTATGKVTHSEGFRGAAAFSSDGKMVAVATSDRVTVLSDKLETLWSIEGASKPRFTSDGGFLATFDSTKGQLTVTSTETKKPVVAVKTSDPGPVWNEGDTLYIAEANTVWSLTNGETKKVFSHPEGRARVESVANGHVLFSTQKGSEVWSLADGSKTYGNEIDSSHGALLLPDGRSAYYPGQSAALRETDGGKAIEILGVSGTALVCETSADEKFGYIKVASQGAQWLVVNDLTSRKTIGLLPTKDERPVFVAGGRIAHFTGKGVEIVELPSMKTERTAPWPDCLLAASQNGSVLAAAPRNGHDIFVVDPLTFRQYSHGSLSGPMDIALDAGGQLVAVTDSGVVRILPTDTLSDMVKSKGQSGYRKGIFFVAGTKLLAMVAAEGFVGQQQQFLAFMDTMSGVVQTTGIRATALHSSADRSRVAVLGGSVVTVFLVPSLKPVGTVSLGAFGLSDGVPLSSGGIWFGGETRFGVARAETPKTGQ